jgi:hypothetical protein
MRVLFCTLTTTLFLLPALLSESDNSASTIFTSRTLNAEPRTITIIQSDIDVKTSLCEISSSHGGEYDVENCLLGCTAV